MILEALVLRSRDPDEDIRHAVIVAITSIVDHDYVWLSENFLSVLKDRTLDKKVIVSFFRFSNFLIFPYFSIMFVTKPCWLWLHSIDELIWSPKRWKMVNRWSQSKKIIRNRSGSVGSRTRFFTVIINAVRMTSKFFIFELGFCRWQSGFVGSIMAALYEIYLIKCSHGEHGIAK